MTDLQEREDSDEKRKELIKKIKRADLITVYLCIRHLNINYFCLMINSPFSTCKSN